MNPDFYYMEQYFGNNKQELLLYSRKGKEIIDIPFNPYCFVKGKDENGLVEAINHKPVKKKEFETSSEVVEYVFRNKQTWEGDIPYERRCMLDMEWKINDVPKCYLDIETDDSHGAPDMTRDPIISIGMIFDDGRKIFLDGEEKDILYEFKELTQNTGMIITYYGGQDVWETRSFDIPYLATRWGIVMEGLEGHSVKFPFDKMMRHCAFVDIYQIYKYETSRVGKSLAGGMSLDNVAKYELGHGKVPRSKKVTELTDKELEEYNMRDVEVLKEIDEKFSFTDLKIGLAQLTHTTLQSWRNNKRRREQTPLIMVDQLLLKECRKMGLVLPNRVFDKGGDSITGALVLEPKVGVHHNVQNFDVKQMYPSIMINEQVSPDKKRVVVPNILKRLKEKRAVLKKRYEETKSTEDYITQYNYKVLANVFYGAVANPACRIYDRKLAQYITSKGQKILSEIKDLCEELGFDVVYGDTDSVFTKIEKDKVPTLEKLINEKIKPYEIEAGEFYSSILYTGDMSGGTKKRYAGMHEEGEIKIVGLESVRRDYCYLARKTQKKVLRMILEGKSIDEINQYLDQLKKKLFDGELNEDLIISKGVKSLEDYKFKETKNGVHRGLPHIRALKIAIEKGYKNMFDIQFVYTKEDVYPVINDQIPKDIDYERYWDRQIMAVVKPLIKSVMIGEGTWREPQRLRGKKLKTMSQNLLDHLSS